MRTGSGLVLALLLATGTACGSDGGSEPEVQGTPDGPRVELIDAGDEPREKIRLDLREGDKTHATMTLRTSLGQTINGQRGPGGDTPPIQMGMAVEVVDVGDDGTVEAEFVYDEMDVLGTGGQAEQVRAGLEDVVGLSGTMRSTDTGALVEGSIDVPDGAPAQMKAMMSSFESQLQGMTVPFPTEAVGIGARWEVTSELELGGIEVVNTTRYHFVERTEEGLVFEVELTQDAPEQDPDLPGVPADADVHLEEMTNTGTGRSVIDPRQLMPVSSRSRLTGQTRLTIEQDGEKAALVQDMKMRMEISRD